MKTPVSHFLTTISALLTLGIQPAAAQPFEAAGLRAMGMGGAFVAVANDSSATWWNPAGLATGPFLDIALTGASGESGDALPASRTGLWSFSLGTPPLGVSYYRLRLTDIRAASPTAPAEAGREDRAAGVGIRSLSVSQFGATVLHTITTGVSAGATVKYLRGRHAYAISTRLRAPGTSPICSTTRTTCRAETGRGPWTSTLGCWRQSALCASA